VVASDSFRPGLHAARIGPDGALLVPMRPIDERWRLTQLDLVALPGGGAILVGNDFAGSVSSFVAARLAADGEIDVVWEGPEVPPYLLVPAVEIAAGRIFVQGGAAEGTHLEIRELGCVR
jgi:hypothetical protein